MPLGAWTSWGVRGMDLVRVWEVTVFMGLASLRRDRSAERSHPLQPFNALLGANHHAVTSLPRGEKSRKTLGQFRAPAGNFPVSEKEKTHQSGLPLPQKDDLLKGKGNCHLSLLQKLKFGLACQNKICLFLQLTKHINTCYLIYQSLGSAL